MANVRAVVAMHIHGPNYQCAWYKHDPSPLKDTLLVVYWYLVSLAGAIVCGYTTCCVVAAFDVLTDTGTA